MGNNNQEEEAPLILEARSQTIPDWKMFVPLLPASFLLFLWNLMQQSLYFLYSLTYSRIILVVATRLHELKLRDNVPVSKLSIPINWTPVTPCFYIGHYSKAMEIKGVLCRSKESRVYFMLQCS